MYIYIYIHILCKIIILIIYIYNNCVLNCVIIIHYDSHRFRRARHFKRVALDLELLSATAICVLTWTSLKSSKQSWVWWLQSAAQSSVRPGLFKFRTVLGELRACDGVDMCGWQWKNPMGGFAALEAVQASKHHMSSVFYPCLSMTRNT